MDISTIDHRRHRRDLETPGWSFVERVVSPELCARLVAALRERLDVPVDEPRRWPEYAKWDIVPVWGHQAQWHIRQLPDLDRVWSALWGTRGP